MWKLAKASNSVNGLPTTITIINTVTPTSTTVATETDTEAMARYTGPMIACLQRYKVGVRLGGEELIAVYSVLEDRGILSCARSIALGLSDGHSLPH